MKWPWQKTETRSHSSSLVALANLPASQWGRMDAGALMRDGYAGNAVAYRAVRMIAEAAASIPLACSDDAAASLLASPSPDEAGRVLLERLYGDLQITGNAWAEAVTLAGDTAPKGLFALRADTVRAETNAQGGLTAWKVRQRRGERLIPRAPDGWNPVLHLKLYHPSDNIYGLPPLAAARKALDLHNGAASWAKALLDNAARPSGALVYGQDGATLTPDQFERLKEELEAAHTGQQNAGRPLLLDGGLDWKPMSLSPAEMDFAETRHAAAREIALAFGVPPMLLGIPGDNTYSTYREANIAFWRLTVLPLVTKVADALTVWLAGRFEDAVVKPDLEDVPAFAAEREALWARLEAASFLTKAEKRKLAGLGE
ncbi:phage portal protein [Henriciella aquimarina]|uniref:phage portal protein n=1 Tax=Henriciella aquimarina TaxID=545261 RepID=UPI000A03D0B5|nr:phage portal protein [Henriciella aquimarina]